MLFGPVVNFSSVEPCRVFHVTSGAGSNGSRLATIGVAAVSVDTVTGQKKTYTYFLNAYEDADKSMYDHVSTFEVGDMVLAEGFIKPSTKDNDKNVYWFTPKSLVKVPAPNHRGNSDVNTAATTTKEQTVATALKSFRE